MRLVLVVVTDKKGQPITGLKAEDFTAGANQLRLAVLDNKTGFIGTATGAPGQ